MAVSAGEQDFQAWEKLVDEGIGYYEAAHQIGTTLRRLKNGDALRYEAGLELCRERQAARVEKKMRQLTDVPEPSERLLLAEAKARHPAYADKQQIEISGTINHEAKVVTLGAILEVSEGTGVDLGLPGGPRKALPSAEDLRAAPAEPAAGGLPARAEP